MSDSGGLLEGKPSIGVVGWGRMGGPMGRRLIGAGHDVFAFDPSFEAQADARDAGATVLASAHDVAARTDTIVTMLPDGASVRVAALEPEVGVLSGLKPGSLWLEMTSSLPEITREVADRASDRRVDVVDAPVTGGVAKAREGTLTVMVAGTDAAVDRAMPVLRLLAQNIHLVGSKPGMGDVVKTVNNLLSAANLLVAAEGLALAVKCGIDPADLVAVINEGTGQSNATTWKIPQYVLTGRYDSGFTIGQYIKDLDVALHVAAESGVQLGITPSVVASWRSIAAMLSTSDHTEVVRAVLEAAGARIDEAPGGDGGD